MHAIQRCSSIPLCDHSRPHHDRIHVQCSTPWPTLPHRACSRQSVSVGSTLRRSRSTREKSRESFSAVAFPRHVVSRRHVSQSFVPSKSQWIASPDQKDATPAREALERLPSLREQRSKTSIRANYDEDEGICSLSECETEFDSFIGEGLPTSTPPQQTYEQGSTAAKLKGITININSRSSRADRCRSLPFVSLQPSSADSPTTRRSTSRPRSLFLLSSVKASPRPPFDSRVQPSSSPPQVHENTGAPAKPTLQPSPTITRTRAIKFSLGAESQRPPHERRPTVTSPPLYLFPVTNPPSPTGSLDSSRTTSSYGGTTINSASHANIFNMYLKERSVFEDDDDDEKKGLIDSFWKLGKKRETTKVQERTWRRFFCCFSGAIE